MSDHTASQALDIKTVVASKTNPRKTFNPTAHQELVSSVKQHGVLQPILVRPINGGGKYEVVAGERRYRAAKDAGLATIPAIVRKLDDVSARELQIVENLQREDVHPLEESLGYKALLELREGDPKQGKPIYTIESIAQKVGKSASYIYQSLKLADLSEPFQRLFIEKPVEFTAGHAILVARLTPSDQEKLLKEYWRPDHKNDFPSVRALKQVIFERLMLKLDAAPWKKDDPTFGTPNAKEINPHAKPAKDPLTSSKASTYGELPACTVCPLNTCVSAQLFPDLHGGNGGEKRDCRCTNPKCYETKMAIHLSRTQAELAKKHPNLVPVSRAYNLDAIEAKRLPGVLTAQSYEEVKKTASGARPALVVHGNDRGNVIYVAEPKKPSGPVSAVRRERPVAERLKELDEKIKTATRMNVLMALAKSAKLDDTLLPYLAAFAVSEGLDQNQRTKLFGEETFKNMYSYRQIYPAVTKFDKPHLIAALVAGVFGRAALHDFEQATDQIFDLAKHYRVDVKKIETTTRAAFAADRERITGKKDSKAPKAKAAKAKPKASQTSARKRA